MRTLASFRALIAAVAAVVASCSSSGGGKLTGTGGSSGAGGSGAHPGDGGAGTGGGACPTFTKCGGNVVGAWLVTDSCVTLTQDLSSTCAGLSAVSTFSLSGASVAYNADLTYSQTGVGSATTQFRYPAACLQGMTCAELGQALAQAGGFDSVTCAATAAGGCTCDARLADVSQVESGTYSTSGATITTVHDGTSDDTDYCVNGDVMHQLPATTDGVVAGAVTLDKAGRD